MKLKKAVGRFNELKIKHEAGKLKDKSFVKQVEKIRGISPDGEEWKVDTEGNWYRKDGDEWVRDTFKKNDTSGPQNLLELLFLILKGFVTNIPRRLLYMVIIGAIVFVVHTYLVIYPNGGYWPGTNGTLDKILSLVGNRARGTAFWSLAVYFTMSVLGRIRMIGPVSFFSGIFKGPVRTIKSAFGGNSYFLPFFMTVTALLLLLAQFFIKNAAISITLIAGAVFAIITFRSDISYLFLKLAYQDMNRLFKRKGQFKEFFFDAWQLAVIASMLLFIFLPVKPYSVYGICILAIASLFYGKIKKSDKAVSNMLVICIAGINFAIMYLVKAYGDDGGVYEAGGFIPWITSPGAFTAVVIGLPPSLGAALGGLLGVVANEVAAIGYEAGQLAAEAAQEVVDDAMDSAVEFVDDAEEFAEDFVETAGDLADEAVDYVDGIIEDGMEAGEALVDDAEEIYDGIQDQIEDMLTDGQYDVVDMMNDMYDSYFGDIEDKLEGILSLGENAPGFIGDKITDAQDYILTTSIMDSLFDAYENNVPDWFTKGAEDSANEAWDYMGVTKDLLDLGGYIPKDSPIPNLMDYAGYLKDGLDNMGMGDNAVYAGIKSYLSNKIKGLVINKDTNPGLVLMDALTTIFAGGTEAGDIISPGKTIQGGANFIIDKVTDMYNGTDDTTKRLGDGKYGGVWKVADQTTKVMADAVYDDNFSEDFSNVMTSDDFYDGMYETNKNLWKPKEGSWAVKRAGCYVGEKTCEGFIKIADGVHVFSQWLGSKFGG